MVLKVWSYVNTVPEVILFNIQKWDSPVSVLGSNSTGEENARL